MKCFVLIWFALQAITCGAHVHPSAYHPVFEYDVPVASQPIVYGAPGAHTGPYYGSYAVHTTPAVSHTFSQTQTHPVAYVKPATVYGASSSGQYYGPTAATSRVEHSRLIVPQIYRFNQQYNYPQQADGNRESNRKYPDERRQDQQYNFQNQYSGNGRGQNNPNVYADRNPHKSNGEQVKLRRYQIHRPGIKKEFYDVEERVIVRPVGSALIELDPPSKKQDITNYRSGSYAPAQAFRSNNNNQYDSSQSHNPNEQYFSTGTPDCGGYFEQSPVYSDRQYHPTTFAPSTTTSTPYPTTVYPTTPSQTYLPPFSTDYSTASTQSTYSPEYTPSTTYSSTPGQYTPTTTTAGSSTATKQSDQSDVYISSTTPVSVVIVDKSNDANQINRTGQDIIYAGQGQSVENSPDQFQNELPPRGDISQYRADEDQFYHELPRSRYSNDPSRPPQTFNVYSRSNGEPTEGPYYRGQEAEVVEIGRNHSQNNQNQTSTGTGNDQQARLIELYTGNDGVSEVGQTVDRTNSQYVADGNRYNSDYGNSDVGKVRARVVSVTPPPATAIPTETVNQRRIVVSKPVTTVQEVVELENSTSPQNGRHRDNYADNRYQNNFESNNNGNNYNQNFNSGFNGNYRNVESNTNQGYDQNLNGDSQAKRANYEKTAGSNGLYISATPTTASERIIYVQPVSQDFAQQKSVAPKQK